MIVYIPITTPEAGGAVPTDRWGSQAWERTGAWFKGTALAGKLDLNSGPF